MNNSLDATIPVLTEVIAPPPMAEPAPADATPPAAVGATNTAAALRAAPHVANTQPQQAVLSERDWEQLEQRLSERVLKQLQGRVDFVLEQRVRDSLADVLQLALVGLTSEIKRGLQQTLEEVISRAVQQEITRLQSLKK